MSETPVSDEDVLAIIENGNWAPSHGQTEPWRFRIFRGESRQTLADKLAEIYGARTPAEQFLETKHKKLSTLPLKAPVAILVWMKRQEIRKIPEIEEVEAVACAIQNMHLTASAMGMAAFWSSPTVLYTNEMNEWMSIGDDDKCLGIFYLGWPAAGTPWPSSSRGSIADKIEWA